MSSVPPPGAPPEPTLREPPPPAPPGGAGPSAEELPAWPAWTALVALIAALLFALFGALVVALVGAAFGASLDHPPPAVNIVATVVQDLGFIGAALAFAARGGPLRLDQLGLRRTRPRAAVGWAVLVLLAFYALSVVWAAVLNLNEKDQLPSNLGVEQSTVALVAVCVVVTVIAPIAEELLFRGYMFTALRTWRGPWVAAVLTGLLFGAVHIGSAPVAFLVPLAILGFLLCLLRWRTRSLLPCMAVHALNNSIAFAVNEAGWSAGETVLLILGANAVILLGMLPLTRRVERGEPASGVQRLV